MSPAGISTLVIVGIVLIIGLRMWLDHKKEMARIHNGKKNRA